MRQRIWKLTIFTLFIIITLFLGMAVVSIPVYASSTVLSVDPSIILDETLTPGSTFYINVTVADVSHMWGYEVILSYDTTVLTATSSSSYDPFVISAFDLDDADGWVYLASWIPVEKERFSTVDPAPIARIDFTVDALGTSILDLHRTVFVDIETEEIIHDVVDGYFRNAPVVGVGRIEGFVTDADTGLAIEGAAASADGYSDATDSLGFYSLEVLPDTYDVTAKMTGYISETVTGVEVLAVETVVQDFALVPIVGVGWIEGTITDSATSLPIKGVNVTAGGYLAVTDSLGFYSLEVLPGTYSVIARRFDEIFKVGKGIETEGYYSQRVTDVSVAADQTIILDFALDPIVHMQGTVLSVDPSIILDETLTPGSTFYINVTVADVSHMWGYEVILSYDTTVLTATSFTSYDPFSVPWPSTINDEEGYVAVAYSMLLGEWVGFSTVDPTPIVRIDFTVDTLGTSLLDLAADTESSLYEGRYHLHTILTDIMGEPITHDTVDGDFNNIGEDRDTFVTHVTLNVTPFLTWIVAVIVIIFFKVSSI